MSRQSSRRAGGSLGFVVGFGIGIPATIFALSNLESVTVEFLGWEAETPLWAVITLSLLAGILLGLAILLTWQARRRRGRKKQARQRAREAQQVDDEPSAAGQQGPDAVGGHADSDPGDDQSRGREASSTRRGAEPT